MVCKSYEEKTKFQIKFESEESQRLIEKLKPAIVEMATMIINKEKNNTIDNYFISPRKLDIKWLSTDQFVAFASVSNADNNHYSINFSYGVPLSLYLESSTFSKVCSTEYKKNTYDVIFKEFDSGEGREHIFPKELTSDSLKLSFFDYSFRWIYYHEQSHLLQGHVNLYNKHANHEEYMGITDNEWHDSSNKTETELKGKNAELRHVFELSADYEAIYHIIGEFIKTKQLIKTTDMWIFTVCLNCIFNDFYGTKHDFNEKEATGTHPNPAARMRMALSHFHSLLTAEGMNKFFEKGKVYEDYLKAILHAIDVSTFYIAHLYHKDLRPEFMNRMKNFDTQSTYYKNLAYTWSETREDVKDEYFGFDDFPFMSL